MNLGIYIGCGLGFVFSNYFYEQFLGKKNFKKAFERSKDQLFVILTLLSLQILNL